MPCAVILTALRVEYLAVQAHLTNRHEETHPSGTVYERGTFATNGQTWTVGIAEISAGNPGAAMEAERAISYFSPEVILFVGIAGGIKDVALGDVVASTKVYGYESGKAEKTFKPRPEIGLSAYSLEQRARAEARKPDWLRRLPASTSASQPQVFVAPIAAGEKVVASTESEVFQFLQSNYGDAVAVEMEGIGFLEATRANQQVSAMVIRGISDLIDNKTAVDKAGFQEVAAHHASAFAFELLANFRPADLHLPPASGYPLPLSFTMQLNGSQREEFHKALLSAFPTQAKLAQMLSFKLNQNLNTIAGNQNLSQAVFELIDWAESEGRVEELLTAARSQNSGNSLLRAFEEQVHPSTSDKGLVSQTGLNSFISSAKLSNASDAMNQPGSPSQKQDFFISYNKADKSWAEWISWILEEAGYGVVVQAWDFRPGGNFVLDMQRAMEGTERTIAILSDDYLNAAYTQPEWADAFRRDPKGTERILIPIRVIECQPTGLLGSIVYVDLVGLSEPNARRAILGAFTDRAKPDQSPVFPGERATPTEVPFPGSHSTSPSSVQPPIQASLTQSPHAVDRLTLMQTLNALPPQQFNMLIFTLDPPAGLIPPMPAPQGDRVFHLLNWAQGPGGCSLATVQQELDRILNP